MIYTCHTCGHEIADGEIVGLIEGKYTVHSIPEISPDFFNEFDCIDGLVVRESKSVAIDRLAIKYRGHLYDFYEVMSGLNGERVTIGINSSKNSLIVAGEIDALKKFPSISFRNI